MKKKLIEIISAVLALLMLLSPVTAFALEYEIPAPVLGEAYYDGEYFSFAVPYGSVELSKSVDNVNWQVVPYYDDYGYCTDYNTLHKTVSYYRIRINENGVFSDYSNVVAAVPTPNSVYAYSYYDDALGVQWDDYQSSYVDGYIIYRMINGSAFERVATVPANGTDSYSYVDSISASKNGGAYSYSVAPYFVCGGQEYSNTDLTNYVTSTFDSKNTTTLSKSSSVKITWGSVQNATSYKVTYTKCRIKDNKTVQRNTIAATTSSCSYTLKKADTKNYVYYFDVECFNGAISFLTISFDSSASPYAMLNGATKVKKKSVKVINTRKKKSSTAWSISLSAKDKKTLAKFAKKHFKSGWSRAKKAEYVLNWINKNVKYATGKNYSKIGGKTYVDAIFNKKLGQCLQYNGAYAMFLTYLGYEARIIQGYRGTPKKKWSHYWCEVKLNGRWYLCETGNYGKNGYWMYFCSLYGASGGYLKNNKAAKD